LLAWRSAMRLAAAVPNPGTCMAIAMRRVETKTSMRVTAGSGSPPARFHPDWHVDAIDDPAETRIVDVEIVAALCRSLADRS
jgi:hypothetical protein